MKTPGGVKYSAGHFFALYRFLEYGGPDGELGASLRYLSQRFSMPVPELKATLTDIGTGVSKMLPFKMGASVFESVKCHFPGNIDKYTSILFLSKTTILSSICL